MMNLCIALSIFFSLCCAFVGQFSGMNVVILLLSPLILPCIVLLYFKAPSYNTLKVYTLKVYLVKLSVWVRETRF